MLKSINNNSSRIDSIWSRLSVERKTLHNERVFPIIFFIWIISMFGMFPSSRSNVGAALSIYMVQLRKLWSSFYTALTTNQNYGHKMQLMSKLVILTFTKLHNCLKTTYFIPFSWKKWSCKKRKVFGPNACVPVYEWRIEPD